MKVNWLSFYKIQLNGDFIYGLEAHNIALNKYGLSNTSAKVNINGEFYELNINNYAITSLIGVTLHKAIYDVPKNLVDEIYSANRIALKFTLNDGRQFVYILPDKVLAEWKEVINTTE